MNNLIHVKEFLAEDGEDYYSVSFGFQSEISENDVLFIVCSKERSSAGNLTDQDGLYFERYDQLYSGYNFAESIVVKNQSVVINFTVGGYTWLQFPANQICFEFSSAKGVFSTIQNTFEKMSKLEWINVINFED
jgi:hypothetical protein